MAITVNQSANASGESNSFTITYNHSGTDGMLLVSVGLLPNNDQYVYSITYNGVSLIKLNVAKCESKAYLETWYLINPTEGQHDIIITLSESAKAICTAASFTGVNQLITFYFETTIAGKDVENIPFKLREEAGNLILGIGFTNGLAYSYTLPGQTELWNVAYNNEIRAQALYAFSTNTGDLEVPNYLSEISTWVVALMNIKAT
jgi:hypothetical protein